jgi:uncharacterized protein YkwD
MERESGAVRAGWAVVVASLALSSCGGDGGSSKLAGGVGRVGEARLATNHRAAGLESAERRRGIFQGVPSLGELEPGPPPAAVRSRQRSCSGGGLEPTNGNLGQLARASRCLINVERAVRGLRGLRENRRLARAALAHARDMVRRSYFAHDAPSGATFVDRIKLRGYMNGRVLWTVGENLAWGSGSRSRPRDIHERWMRSPPHRANILNRRFREIGIAVVFGAPAGRNGLPAATYNTDFGARRRSR